MLLTHFGSKTTERCLLFLVAQEQGYALEISQAFGISGTQVRRTRLYSLNPRWFLFSELKALLKKALTQMPFDQQAKVFGVRKKPRKKNKPI